MVCRTIHADPVWVLSYQRESSESERRCDGEAEGGVMVALKMERGTKDYRQPLEAGKDKGTNS